MVDLFLSERARTGDDWILDIKQSYEGKYIFFLRPSGTWSDGNGGDRSIVSEKSSKDSSKRKTSIILPAILATRGSFSWMDGFKNERSSPGQ